MDSPTIYSQERKSMEEELLIALEEASLEAGINFSPSVFSNALFWTGDSDAFIGYRLKNWLVSMRRRTRTASLTLEAHQRPTLSDLSSIRLVSTDRGSIVGNEDFLSSRAAEHDSEEMCLKERLKMSIEMDINSTSFTWGNLVSLHHTEHAPSSCSEDDKPKPVEVTVNSGGVVFFATFGEILNSQLGVKEAVAVLKFTSSSLVTQSERLGNELAKHMGVFCPQSRVIYKGSDEWMELLKAVEKCSDAASSVGDEDNKATCTEFLEVFNLSHCVLLMGYIKGCPFLEHKRPFQGQAAAQNTATALARIFLLDLVLRNEDRLCCPELGWRGNPDNLLCAEEIPLGGQCSGRFVSTSDHTGTFNNNRESLGSGERRFSSADSVLLLQSSDSLVKKTNISDRLTQDATKLGDNTVFLVTIDSGVPRRPPTGKRAMDKVLYPKVIELILNCPHYAASLLYDISGGKLGFSSSEVIRDNIDQLKVVKAFQRGLKKGIREMQNLYIFLLKLYRMLQIMLLKFFQSINAMFPPEDEQTSDELEGGFALSPKGQTPLQTALHNQASIVQQGNIEADLSNLKVEDKPPKRSEEHVTEYSCSIDNTFKKTSDKSPSHGSPRLSKQLTRKLKSVNRTAKVDARLNEELKRWSEIMDAEGRRFCEDHGFVTGFLEGGTSHSVIRNYEFKVRLEHLLERMTLISQGADTERPSQVLENLYIGGAMAAKSLHTIQHIGITHVLCLCPSEFQSCGEEFNKLVCYKEIEVLDQETEDISCKFQEACDFISGCGRSAGKCLVHCFEGRSRSATIILAFLMTQKHLSLSQAWNQLKTVHARSQPNDGFMQALIKLDKELHGSSSMEWKKKRPTLHICYVCGKTTGLSLVALNNHMERFHPGASSLRQ